MDFNLTFVSNAKEATVENKVESVLPNGASAEF